MKWSVCYKKAISADGVLLFPERLTKEFLEAQRRVMGVFLFSNQYLNECIPSEQMTFKPEWLRYYEKIPKNTNTFAFIDPAIGQKDNHDYTGIVIVDVDTEGLWYLRLAKRLKLNPTQIVHLCFEINEKYKPACIGVEIVAYQEALMYLLDERMKIMRTILPVKGIKRSNVSKETRILSLVPRFEWGKLLVGQGFVDFEDEYSTFPRGAHDDILDSLASIDEIAFYPEYEKEKEIEKPNSPSHPDYERWYIQQLARGRIPSKQEEL